MSTINERIAEGRRLLSESGIGHDQAALDARLLAQAVLGWDATRILTAGDSVEPSSFGRQFEELIARRSRREPLAYITGSREFWNLQFEVSPAVLIPRPETEGLIEAFNVLFPDNARPIRIADVCTGSGCVAVAIAVERRHAQLVATDISAEALAVARRNVARHQVEDRVELVHGDLLAPLTERFDAIVANPPYVRTNGRRRLQSEIRDFEPEVALFAEADGLAVIRRLVADAPSRLEPGAYLVFEFGDGQESEVAELISKSAGLRMVAINQDLQGIPRIAITSAI